MKGLLVALGLAVGTLAFAGNADAGPRGGYRTYGGNYGRSYYNPGFSNYRPSYGYGGGYGFQPRSYYSPYRSGFGYGNYGYGGGFGSPYGYGYSRPGSFLSFGLSFIR